MKAEVEQTIEREIEMDGVDLFTPILSHPVPDLPYSVLKFDFLSFINRVQDKIPLSWTSYAH